jgi:glycogen(starch) synthase
MESSSATGKLCTRVGEDGRAAVRPAAALHVLRVCSVFEPPDAALRGPGRRFDPIGGMQSHTGQLTRALDRLGVRQTVLTSRPPGACRSELRDGARVLRYGAAVPWARQGYALPVARAAWRQAGGADLVHAHLGEDVAVLPLALAAARRAGIPLVVTVHTSVRHTYRPAGVRGHVLAAAGGVAETLVLRRAARVIALTPRLAGRLLQAGLEPERVRVVPSGIVPALFAGDAPDPLPAIPRPRVLFVGRLHRQKGVGVLIEACARMSTEAHLVLVGDGPERDALRRAAGRNGLDGRMHITGFLPHRAVPAAMRHADVLVLPSLYEELGSTLLEAMQAGVPVVASRTGGVPDAVGDAGVLVAPGDPGALASAIDGLLTDRGAAARLAALGRRRARRFDWEVLAPEVLDVYRGALAR